MRRREFITLVGGAAAWPVVARAQSERLRSVAILTSNAQTDPQAQKSVAVFRGRMENLGWTEGRSVEYWVRWAAGDAATIETYAKELIELSPAAILATGTQVTKALQQRTSTIPIVFVNVADPVTTGIVSNLARPSGNVSGFTNLELTIGGKWIELLSELAPSLRTAAVLFSPENPTSVGYVQVMRDAASKLNLQFGEYAVARSPDIKPVIEQIELLRHAGIVVLASPLMTINRATIMEMTAKAGIPAVYPFTYFASEGGLASFGADIPAQYSQAAGYVDRILRGQSVADLPVQAPTKFELVINSKAARAIGLTVPPLLLTRADEVIE